MEAAGPLGPSRGNASSPVILPPIAYDGDGDTGGGVRVFCRLTFAVALLAAAALPDLAHAAAFDPEQATEAYLATVSGAARAKSDAYFEGGYVLDAANAGINIFAALAILFTGLSRRFRDWADRTTGWRGLSVMLYTALFLFVLTLLTLPFDYYRGFLREHEFGLSNQDNAGWAQDYAIAVALNIVIFSILAAVIYAVIRRAPQTWWLWGTLVATVFAAFLAMVAPVFITPLFNTFTPMDEGPLKAEILSLARANGIPADNVYQFDASRQSKRISANVSGLFGTTRISLNDNLLKRGTPAEIKAVMGHEMGHYVLNHAYKFLVMFVVFFGVILAIVARLLSAFVAGPGQRLGLRDVADPAAMPMLIALLTLFFYVATPVQNTMVRVQEAEADIFGLNAAREPDGFATIALKLAEYRKLDPTPWEERVFYDHPSGRSRVSMAMHFKAEHLADAASETTPAAVTTPPQTSAPPAP